MRQRPVELEDGRARRAALPTPGIWEAVGYTTSNTAKYSQDHGDALYRRSLYLFWKRTAPPPSMTTLDAPSREQCRARRERTDTPLQALLMMNDPPYFEAARQLGYRMLHEGGADDAGRLAYGFRLATARPPAARECAVLMETSPPNAPATARMPRPPGKLVAVGESPVPTDVPPPNWPPIRWSPISSSTWMRWSPKTDDFMEPLPGFFQRQTRRAFFKNTGLAAGRIALASLVFPELVSRRAGARPGTRAHIRRCRACRISRPRPAA